MYQFVIQRQAVADKLLLAQVIAMIGTDDQQRAIQPATRPQLLQECPHQLILVRHLRVIHTIQRHLLFFVQRLRQRHIPAHDIAIEVMQVALRRLVVPHVRREFCREAARWIVGHMRPHQVDEAEDRLVLRHVPTLRQQQRSVIQRLCRVAFETQRRLPERHHQW